MKPARQKILVTGTTSQQYSSRSSSRSEAFSDGIRRIAEDAGYEVTMCPPSFDWSSSDVLAFDRVFVGIAPMLSLSANCAYGALFTVDSLWESENLTLFCDSPEPWKIFANLRAVEKNQDALFKSFYSRRPGYQRAVSDSSTRESIVSGVDKLLRLKWPTTLVPALPWSPSEFPGVQQNAARSFKKFYVDSYMIHESTSNGNCDGRWLVENHPTKWTKTVTSSLSSQWTTLRELKSNAADSARGAMATKIGTIIGPHSDKMTWWSPRYAQSLSVGVPVVTDWKVSMTLGASWSHLASSVDEMNDADRLALANSQRQQYTASIWSRDECIDNVRLLTTGV